MSTDEKARALAAHFKVAVATVTDGGHGTYTCESEPGEYMILTDEEAETAWDESLDSYLDDCLLCELPAIAQQYFDCDAWKRDARHDGRGHCLSSYDGAEHEVKVDGEWFYVYRTN